MPDGLLRRQHSNHLHYITFSCYERKPFLATEATRDVFETALERFRARYQFRVIGYVIMPEHVHLLLSETMVKSLSVAIQAIKLSVSKQLLENQEHFWYPRYYDFNVYTQGKKIEKLKSMHKNPVARELVTMRDEWRWSSYRFYLTRKQGRVQIAPDWEPGYE